LIVGAAAGLGGNVIRTVSFFGCTFTSAGFGGGTAPSGELGKFSAIKSLSLRQTYAGARLPSNHFERIFPPAAPYRQQAVNNRRNGSGAIPGIPAITRAAETARRPFLAWACNIHDQRTALEFLSIELLNGLFCLLDRRKFHKCKPARFSGEFVLHQIHRRNYSCLREVVMQILLQGLI